MEISSPPPPPPGLRIPANVGGGGPAEDLPAIGIASHEGRVEKTGGL